MPPAGWGRRGMDDIYTATSAADARSTLPGIAYHNESPHCPDTEKAGLGAKEVHGPSLRPNGRNGKLAAESGSGRITLDSWVPYPAYHKQRSRPGPSKRIGLQPICAAAPVLRGLVLATRNEGARNLSGFLDVYLASHDLTGHGRSPLRPSLEPA